MKERLKQIQESITNLLLFSDENAKRYINLLNEAVTIIEKIEVQPDSVLETWKNQALIEISNELANRVNSHFFSADLQRKKTEFKYSKVVVNLALNNVLANW